MLHPFSIFFILSFVFNLLQVLVEKDPGFTGNLLVERLVGAHIELVSKEEYAKLGSAVCSCSIIAYYAHLYACKNASKLLTL